MLILVVEDSKMIAKSLRRKLEAMGHEVALAEDGQAAVDWFISGKPDLIVMDIEMPVMNGFDAARKIRAIEDEEGDEGAWTPIVFLTATDTVDNLLSSLEAGGDDFLPKSANELILGAKIGSMGRISNILKRMRALTTVNRSLTKDAGTDVLTTLPNRRALEAKMDQINAKGAEFFAVMMIDVDNFKLYNDSLGHEAGDRCLEKLGKEIGNLAEDLGDNAFAARYGGEEFTFILQGVEREEALDIANSICMSIESLGIYNTKNGSRSVVTVSIGVSGRMSGKSVQDYLKAADIALYEVKKSGRGHAKWTDVNFRNKPS